MAITPATVEAYLETANTALDGDDYAAARKAVIQARIAIARLPDTEKGGVGIEWDRRCADILDAIDALQNGAGDGLAQGFTPQPETL